MNSTSARSKRHQTRRSETSDQMKLFTSTIFLTRLSFSKRKIKPWLLTAHPFFLRKPHSYQHTCSAACISCVCLPLSRFNCIALVIRQPQQSPLFPKHSACRFLAHCS